MSVTGVGRPMRADAQRNYARLLDAASTAFFSTAPTMSPWRR